MHIQTPREKVWIDGRIKQKYYKPFVLIFRIILFVSFLFESLSICSLVADLNTTPNPKHIVFVRRGLLPDSVGVWIFLLLRDFADAFDMFQHPLKPLVAVASESAFFGSYDPGCIRNPCCRDPDRSGKFLYKRVGVKRRE